MRGINQLVGSFYFLYLQSVSGRVEIQNMRGDRKQDRVDIAMGTNTFFLAFFCFLLDFFVVGTVRVVSNSFNLVVWFGTKPDFYRNTVRYYVYLS